MKKYFALTVTVLALISLAGVVKFAFAGPEPLSAKEIAPAPLPECNWTGFYFGGLAGYARGDLHWKDVDFGDDETLVNRDQSGALYGGELGFNYQWNWLVLGIEGTFAYSDVQAHTNKSIEDEVDSYGTRSNWQGTIGGRLGVAWNHLLFYGKGGAAFNEQSYSWLHHEDSRFPDTFDTDETRVGAFVGVGVEYMFNCHWSAKLEYNHSFLGTDTITGTRIDDGAPEEESYDVKLNQDTVLVGINYKFWGFR